MLQPKDPLRLISLGFRFLNMVDSHHNIGYKLDMHIRKLILTGTLFLMLLNSCSSGLFNNPIGNTATATAYTPATMPSATPVPNPTPQPTPLQATQVSAGAEAYRNGDYPRAIEDYSQAFAMTTDPGIKANALAMLGRIYYEQGDIQKSLDTLRSVISEYADPDAVSMAALFLAEIHLQLLRPAEAASNYQLYLDLKPGLLDDVFLEKQGDALTANNQYAEANAAYRKAIEAGTVSPATGINLKIAANLSKLGQTSEAIQLYQQIQQNTSNEFDDAQAEFLIGQIYYSLGQYETAYTYFQNCVDNYPKAGDSYSALIALVNDNQQVNDLHRGIVDYFAGQFEVAIEALDDYMEANATHDGTLHYYKALSYTALKDYSQALVEWDALIRDHPGDRFWASAWDEKAYTLWFHQGKYGDAARTLLDFVITAPQDAQAPGFLFDAGRIYERGDDLNMAAITWERLADEYPEAVISYSGIYLAGITRYRQADYQAALNTFQRALLLASEPADIASAYLWIGKSLVKLGDPSGAREAWQQAVEADPSGYYSERARDLLLDRQVFSTCNVYDLAVDLDAEKTEAISWMCSSFDLASDVELESVSSLADDPRMVRGLEFLRLGFYDESRQEFEALRKAYELDPVNTFRLVGFFMENHQYRQAIFAARQVLSLAGLDDTNTLKAPKYFNHIRFGAYYREVVINAGEKETLSPLLILSVIRQESLFERNIGSTAGAKGLMQLMPETARQTSAIMGWPQIYRDTDIYLPVVNIGLGSHYLRMQLDDLEGDYFAALAAYNAGPAGAIWQQLADGDPDLYLEVVRYLETRNYIRSIVEQHYLYRMLYCREQ